jgi:hypothetical protein
MTEHRRSPRREVLKGCQDFFSSLGTATDCTVRNFSDTGALLVVTSSVGVPEEFGLVFSTGEIKRAERYGALCRNRCIILAVRAGRDWRPRREAPVHSPRIDRGR